MIRLVGEIGQKHRKAMVPLLHLLSTTKVPEILTAARADRMAGRWLAGSRAHTGWRLGRTAGRSAALRSAHRRGVGVAGRRHPGVGVDASRRPGRGSAALRRHRRWGKWGALRRLDS